MSSLHILSFTLLNTRSLSLDPDGPFPTFFRLMTVRSPSIHKLDLSEFSGCTILITGATSGCGLECARALGRVGCNLVLTARSQERGQHVLQQVQKDAKDAGVDTAVNLIELDMCSFESVKLLPLRLKELGVEKLDIAVLNAGVYQTEFSICPETGWEETIQVNLLSTTAVNFLLRPFLSRAEKGRLLLVSSEAHAWADPRHDSTEELLTQLNKPEPSPYPCYQLYHISKLLLNLWAYEISKRDEWNGISVAVVSPGFTRSGLFRDFNNLAMAKAVEAMVCRSSESAATQYIYALQEMGGGKGNGGFWSDGGWRAPSIAVSRSNGQGLRSTVYADVMKILTSAAVAEDAQ